MSDTPNRCYTIDVSVGGDTWDDAVRELLRVAEHVEQHGPECNETSGGPVAGSHVTIAHRPEMTHDAYFEAIERWREARASDGE